MAMAGNRSGRSGVPLLAMTHVQPPPIQPRTPDWQPPRWSVAERARIATVLGLLAAVRKRRWLQTAVRRLTAWLALALLAVAPQWWLQRLDLAHEVELRWALSGLVLVACVHALWQRHPWRTTATQVDARLATHDAFATALWLAQSGRADGWAVAQAARAQQVAGATSPALVQPWTRPRALPWALAAGGILILATFAPVEPFKGVAGVRGQGAATGLALGLPGLPRPFTSAAALLGEDSTKLLQADAAMLAEIGEQVTDEPTRKWLQDVKTVVDGVAEGKLDKRQALEMLAQLEMRKPAAPQNPFDAADMATANAEESESGKGGDGASQAGADAPSQEAKDQAQEQKDKALRSAVSEAVKEAVQAAPKGQEQQELLEAAAKQDLGMLAKLAEKLANKDMSDKELEKWIKVAEKFAGALKDQKVPDKFKELAKRVERLQKKREQEGGLGQSDQERLKSARHELDQLKRESGDALAAQHQVQRLERGAKQAADELRRAQQEDRLGKQSPEEKNQAKEALKKAMRAAASEMHREQERQQDRQAQRIAQGRMRDMREALERSGSKREQGQQRFEQQAAGKRREAGQKGGDNDQGEDGPSKSAQDKSNQDGKERGESAEARDARKLEEMRKGGQKPGENDSADGKDGDKPGAKGGQKPGSGSKRNQLGQGSDADFGRMEQIRRGLQQSQGQAADAREAGEMAGDDRESKSRQRIAGGKREQVRGQQGAGPDTKKVFLDAAKKGFSHQGWRDVYVEYSKVADEMLDQEQVPPGRRAVVRHYFELIRPRKGWAPSGAGK